MSRLASLLSITITLRLFYLTKDAAEHKSEPVNNTPRSLDCGHKHVIIS